MRRLVRAYRRESVPLLAYYAVTLAVPVAHGAAQSGATFLKHALVVLLVPPLLVAAAAAFAGRLAMGRRTDA